MKNRLYQQSLDNKQAINKELYLELKSHLEDEFWNKSFWSYDADFNAIKQKMQEILDLYKDKNDNTCKKEWLSLKYSDYYLPWCKYVDNRVYFDWTSEYWFANAIEKVFEKLLKEWVPSNIITEFITEIYLALDNLTININILDYKEGWNNCIEEKIEQTNFIHVTLNNVKENLYFLNCFLRNKDLWRRHPKLSTLHWNNLTFEIDPQNFGTSFRLWDLTFVYFDQDVIDKYNEFKVKYKRKEDWEIENINEGRYRELFRISLESDTIEIVKRLDIQLYEIQLLINFCGNDNSHSKNFQNIVLSL